MNRLEARPALVHHAELDLEPVEVQLPPPDEDADDDADDADEADGQACLPPARELVIERVGPAGERAPAAGHAPRGGQLAVDVPAGACSLVVLALDADGQVLASSDLPLETDLPSEVFLDLLASGLPAAGLEGVDLHVRVTPELATALAAAVRAARSGGRAPTARSCASAPVATRRR